MRLIEELLRPCIVTGQKAIFHRWEQRSEIVDPSLMRGGHQGGVVAQVLGIIEREDGTIHEAYPWEIRFVDGKFEEYFAKMDSRYSQTNENTCAACGVSIPEGRQVCRACEAAATTKSGERGAEK